MSSGLEFKILGRRISIGQRLPPGAIRLDQTLPVLRELDDRAIDAAVEHKGVPVSCAKGCSACCHAPPVPVTPPEAYALLLLVEAMPEKRRTEVRAAFADRVQRLRGAGLDRHFLVRDPNLTADQARAIAREYFSLGLVCPFLSGEACGIYADRPFVCRQYLVTSPAALCANPFENQVAPVPVPIRPATAMLRAASHFLGAPQFTVPLVLALEYAEAHREELARTYDGEALLRRIIQQMFAAPA